MVNAAPIAPHPGPQSAFASCSADMAFLGGALGGGKSWSLVREMAVGVHLAGYEAALFRRLGKQLDGLRILARAFYPLLDGRERLSPSNDWRFPSDAVISLHHLQHEKDKDNHQGREYAVIGFDELVHFTEAQFWYLVTRNRTTCGMHPYVRATLNPDPDHFARKMVAWWIGSDGYAIPERSGVVRWFVRHGGMLHWAATRAELLLRFPRIPPMSFTFILARNSDNPTLLRADPGYVGKLENLTQMERLRMLGERDEKGRDRGGNWNVRPSSGLVFPRKLFNLRRRPPSRIVATVRAWDKGATAPSDDNRDPDWTRGGLVSLCEQGELWIHGFVSLRDRPGVVLARMAETADDDGVEVVVALWQELAQAGKVDLEVTEAALSGYVVEAVSVAEGVIRGRGGRGRAKWIHAKAWAPHLEKGMVYVLDDQPWTEELLGECDGFPDARHDDYVDVISLAWQVLARERRTTLAEAMATVTGLR